MSANVAREKAEKLIDILDALDDEDADQSKVTSKDTTSEVVNTFLDTVEDYAELSKPSSKDELVNEASSEVVDLEDDET
jgi:hypothetical protein